MGTLITIIVFVVVIGFVISWMMRGRSRRRPDAGPTMPDLSTAEEIQRVEQLHDEGKITDAEYHERGQGCSADGGTMAAQLMVEDVPAVELAERFGTPLFAISENSIRERYRRTLAAVRAVYDPVEVYYAVKSNPILAVRRILATEGAGGDAFGPGEVETSLRAGVPGEKLVMNGQAKTGSGSSSPSSTASR